MTQILTSPIFIYNK